MFHIWILLTILGLTIAGVPRLPPVKFTTTEKNLYEIENNYKNGDIIFPGESPYYQQEENYPGEKDHIRYAPQDPVVSGAQSNDGSDSIGHYNGSDSAGPKDNNVDGKNETFVVPSRCNYDCEQQQAQSAHYSFDAHIQDDINDHSHKRTETRDGTKVTGMYSYSDGFFQRTVHYVADENGYRIVKQEVNRIGDGPMFNPSGQADISGSLIGQYSIKIDDSDRQPSYIGVKRT